MRLLGGRRTSSQDLRISGYMYSVIAAPETMEGLGEELLNEIRATAMENMGKAQDLVVSEVKKTLSRRAEKASRPGEPPREVTGALGKSWKKGRRNWRENKTVLRGTIESKHPAAGAFEFGAYKKLGILPRPYYRPTLARIGGKVGDLMVGA